MIENEIFGPTTAEGVLRGSHYVRSLEGMNLLSESMERLQWTAFFDEHGVERYAESLQMLEKMKAKVAEKDRNSSRTFLDSFITSDSSCGLFEDFAQFQIIMLEEVCTAMSSLNNVSGNLYRTFHKERLVEKLSVSLIQYPGTV